MTGSQHFLTTINDRARLAEPLRTKQGRKSSLKYPSRTQDLHMEASSGVEIGVPANSDRTQTKAHILLTCASTFVS